MPPPISLSLRCCPVRSFWQPVLQVSHYDCYECGKMTNIYRDYIRTACLTEILPMLYWSSPFLTHCPCSLIPLPGKWVVTPEYVLDSFKNGSWLTEGPYEIAISTGVASSVYPVRQWREKVASGRLTGAFQGWRVLLMVQEPTRRAMFKRWGATQKCFKHNNHNNLSMYEYNVVLNESYFNISQAPESRPGQSILLPSSHSCLCHSCHG